MNPRIINPASQRLCDKAAGMVQEHQADLTTPRSTGDHEMAESIVTPTQRPDAAADLADLVQQLLHAGERRAREGVALRILQTLKEAQEPATAAPDAKRLSVGRNYGPGDVHFDSIDDVLSFANIASEQVSASLQTAAQQEGEGVMATTLEMIGDLAFQVSQAVQLLADHRAASAKA